MRPSSSRSLRRLGLALAIGACCTAGLSPAPVAAQVPEPFPTHRRGDGTTYSREYRSQKPLRGHEGFYGPGPRLRYCSYMRIPERTCDRRGCRVTGWRLEQTCY